MMMETGGLYRRRNTTSHLHTLNGIIFRADPNDIVVFLKLVVEYPSTERWLILTLDGKLAEYEGYKDLIRSCWEKLC